MKNPVFEEIFKIRYSEMDCGQVLKPSVLLQFFQDLASDNAESLDFGYSYIIRNNLAWFLLKYRIEFDDYPEGIYDITIQTNPRGYNKLFALRDFAILHNNKIIGKAASTWGLIDINSKTMANVSEALKSNPYIKSFEKREDDLVYGKIRPLEKIDIEKTFEIRFDDLDVNQHVNNSNYIVWAFETLNFDFRKSYKLKNIDMVFKKEITYGAKVIAQTEISENITNHVLRNSETGEDLCLIKAEWVKRAKSL